MMNHLLSGSALGRASNLKGSRGVFLGRKTGIGIR